MHSPDEQQYVAVSLASFFELAHLDIEAFFRRINMKGSLTIEQLMKCFINALQIQMLFPLLYFISIKEIQLPFSHQWKPLILGSILAKRKWKKTTIKNT